MKRSLILTLTLLLGVVLCMAERISPQKALEIANDATRTSTAMKTRAAGAPTFSRILTATNEYYVATTTNGQGFAIIAADDAVSMPVGAYSPDMPISADVTKLPPQMRAWLHDYAAVVKAIADGRIPTSAVNDDLKGQAVTPMLTTKWNQGAPYNDLTPMKGSQKTFTGCVATAATQIMKYFNFPSKGKGKVRRPSYYSDDDMLDLSDHTFDWDNMLDEYDEEWNSEADDWVGTWTEAQGLAVATLMRDFGFAVRMGYGTNGSSAYSSDVFGTLVRYFSYSPKGSFIFRDAQTPKEWNDGIRASLVAGSPVYYSGSDGHEGHAFVCDGIDENGMLHINWGWGGMSDGYFDMNVLSPSNLGIGAGGGAYYAEQTVILNLKPGDESADNSNYDAPFSLSNIRLGWRAEDGRLSSRTGTIMRAEMVNSTGRNIKSGEYYTVLVMYDKNGKEVFSDRQDASHAIGAISMGGYYFQNFNFGFGSAVKTANIPDGEYIVKPWFARRSDASEFELVDFREFSTSGIDHVVLTVKNGDFYLEPTTESTTPAVAMLGAKSGMLLAGVNMEMPFNITLKSVSSAQAKGYVLVCLLHEDDDTGTVPDNSKGVWTAVNYTLYPGVTVDLSSSIFGTSLDKPGRYRVYAVDPNNNTDITPKEPVYLDVLAPPTSGIALLEPLKDDEIHLSSFMYYSTRVTPYVVGEYKDDIQFWAYPEDGSEADGFELMTSTGENLKNGQSSWLGAPVRSLLSRPFGRYVYTLKYRDGDEWKEVPGAGNAVLTFSEAIAGSEQVIELVKNAKIGEGDLKQADTVDVELTLKSSSAFKLIKPSFGMRFIADDDENGYGTNASTMDVVITPTDVKAGGEFTIKGKMYVPETLSCGEGKEFNIAFSLYDNDAEVYIASESVRTYPYQESLRKKVLPLPAEEVDIEVGAVRLYDQFVPGGENIRPLVFISLRNNATTPLTHTRMNMYVKPMAATEAPDYGKDPHGSFIPKINPGTWASDVVNVPAECFPVYGEYRVYLTYEDAGKEVPIEGLGDLTIELVDLTKAVQVLACSDDTPKELSPDVDFNISLDLRSGSDYYGPLELWCTTRYDKGEEFKVVEWNSVSLPAGERKHFDLEASSDAFLNRGFGYYTGYFMVRSEDGEMVRAFGDANDLFIELKGIKSGVISLTSDMALDGGGTHARQEEEQHVSFTMSSANDVALDVNESYVILVDEASGDAFSSGRFITIPAAMNANQHHRFEVKFTLPENESAVGKRFIVEPVIVDREGHYLPVRTIEHQESTCFYQDEKAGINGAQEDGAVLRLADKTLLVENADAGSAIEVYDAAGMCVLRRTANGGCESVSLQGLGGGMYVARAVSQGKATTLKFALR